ncbi:MAG: hypothetical protein EOR42_30360 [Mesorhizobium sp.]|nr:MAG: hypothetical protein EOR42_30360 [Mesorhizobium sp.]
MSPRPGSLPSDPAELQRIVLALEAENAELRVYADLLRQMIFGAKSEKLAVLDPTQIALDLGASARCRPRPMTMPPKAMIVRHVSTGRHRATWAPCRSICRASRK